MEAARFDGRGTSSHPERGQLFLLATLLALAALAWLITYDRMGGLEPMSGMGLGGVGFYLTVWVVMMAAMMFPSVAPTVLMYDRLRAGHLARGRGAPADATALFIGGYISVWTAAGLAAYGAFELVGAIDPAFLAWDRAGRWVTGGVIAAAGVYQLTPLKQVCLVKCRSPMMFLAERWRHGRVGALSLGMRHGAWCLGCCWALMAALFALGVMSLGWMALVAALIAAEKLLPRPAAVGQAVAVLLVALALAVALIPSDVPGFAYPDASMDPAAAHDGGGGMGMQMTP